MHRIFIVEDDAAIAAALQKHLTTWGFDVRCAEDFRNVLAECTAFDPQLVLLDITLPFYNGYHWCQELRRVSNVPVVFISSASDNMNIVMAMNMGGDDFIAKPFDLNVLLVWLAVDYRRFAVRLRLLRRLEQEITLSTEQLPEPDGALEAQYQALVRALDADRRAQLTRSQQGYQELVEYYTVWAHQIKTPIAAMRLLLQDADTDEQRALLEQVQSVEQYVEMVLGYLRLESPSSDYVIRNYALDDIVRQVVRKYASQFIRRKLRLEYTPLNVSVITDEKWLLFVIEQVLSNALKYTRSGSVSITLEAPKTLCIRDTGIGIAPEDLPRVFEKGFTGCNGRTDKRATGIGLYLCRRILEKLGHTIAITSTVGEGTTVRIGLQQDALEVE